jgi:molybdopterin/thiamine biosynthesis adenylyltransferase
MYTNLNFTDDPRTEPLIVQATGFPPPSHPSEADLMSRQVAMPGHNQGRLEAAHIGVVGCGGLGSWIALGLVRMGVRRLTLFDGDRFDRTNAPRQLMLGNDVGKLKAHALAANLATHSTNSAEIVGIAEPFGESSMQRGPFDCLIVGVDNNRARLVASRFGIEHRVPVVFGMLSMDGLRAQVFLQRVDGPSLFRVLPNLDEAESARCAAAAITSCFLVAAHAVDLVVNAVMGIERAPIWRESSLDGTRDSNSHVQGRD